MLNDVLLPAMKEVGDKFGAGELILPFVLQIGRSDEEVRRPPGALPGQAGGRRPRARSCWRRSTAMCTTSARTWSTRSCRNNGYTVYDLGKQVPLNTIIEKADRSQADAIGLSALLVSTSKQMPLCVQELHRRGLSFPVLIGGAAINRQYGQRILFVDGTPYEPGVFYCKDAFEGWSRWTGWRIGQREANSLRARSRRRHRRASSPNAAARARKAGPRTSDGARSKVRTDTPIPTPPFWGTRVVKNFSSTTYGRTWT